MRRWMGLLVALWAAGCGGNGAGALDAAVWDRAVVGDPKEGLDGREAGQEEAGVEDAHLERPPYDDTWCHMPYPEPPMDPNVDSCLDTAKEVLSVQWNGGRWVVTGEYRDHVANIWIHDLETGEATALEPKGILPWLWEDEFVFNSYDGTEILLYRLRDRSMTHLWTPPDPQLGPVGYWRPYVFVDNYSYGAAGGSGGLYNMETGVYTQVTEPGCQEEAEALGARYAAWTAFLSPTDRDSCVFYADLQTLHVQAVPGSCPSGGYSIDVSGDRIVWMTGKRGIGWDVYQYEVGQERPVLVDDDPYDQMWPRLNGHLVVWVDYRYTRARDRCAGDLYVHDLETGVGRRVTSQHWWWTVFTAVHDGKFLAGWSRWGQGPNGWRVCFFDLNALGLLDEQGHVIPE